MGGMKILTMSALILALTSGAAFADRHGGGSRGGGGGRSGGVVVHDSNRGGGGWNNNNRVVVRDHDRGQWRGGERGGSWGGGVRVNSSPHYFHTYGHARTNIYMPRPVFHERYYDYRVRPRVVYESYGPRYGYAWISGQWTWDGYEWVWNAGYYQPDSAYVEVY